MYRDLRDRKRRKGYEAHYVQKIKLLACMQEKLLSDEQMEHISGRGALFPVSEDWGKWSNEPNFF